MGRKFLFQQSNELCHTCKATKNFNAHNIHYSTRVQYMTVIENIWSVTLKIVYEYGSLCSYITDIEKCIYNVSESILTYICRHLFKACRIL